MMKKLFKKLNQQRGSATIEACISFTGFLFVIFTILGTVNFCRTQMMISSAVDTAARELSQYAYFYKMSGLQKFSSDLSSNADVGKENINSVIGTVDHLYSSVGSAAKGTVQNATDLYNATTTGNLDMAAVETAITNVDTQGTDVLNSIQSVQNAFEQVGDDPLLYMRSLVAIAGESALDAVKSHVIAVPLAKLFFQKHFGGNRAAADAKLEALGVKDGLDGMNFNMSTVFHSGSPNDIEIVVFYRLSIVQLFDWAVLEADVSKVAVTGAWLAGDNVQATAKKDTSAATNTSTNTGTTTPAETTPAETTPTETTPTETTPAETAPAETTPATEPEKTNKSTGLWALTNNYYMSEREIAFQKHFEETNIVNAATAHFWYHDNNHPDDTVSGAQTFDVYVAWPPSGVFDPVSQLAYDMKLGLKDISTVQYINVNGEPITITDYMKTIYVPDNMPSDQVQKLMEDAAKAEKELEAYAKELGLEDFDVSFYVEVGNGEYDYENGSTNIYDEISTP